MKPTCCNISISASEATGSYTEFIVSRNIFVFSFLLLSLSKYLLIISKCFFKTGLTYIGGVLKHNGKAVDSTSASDGLQRFLQFLSQFPDSILIGHNIQNFDLPVLIHQLSKHNLLKEFETAVSGYLDTSKLSRKAFPKADVGNYKQQNLVQKLIGETYEAHNAIADVSSLQNLFNLKLKYH